MSWLSQYVVDPVANFFHGPDLTPVYNSLAEQQKVLQQSIQQQTDATNKALALQQQSEAAAAAATMPAQDSESARVAAEDRQKKLIAGSGFTPGITNLGAPPVGYRMLTGQ